MGDGFKLYIGGLSFQATKDDLEMAFDKFGRITDGRNTFSVFLIWQIRTEKFLPVELFSTLTVDLGSKAG